MWGAADRVGGAGYDEAVPHTRPQSVTGPAAPIPRGSPDRFRGVRDEGPVARRYEEAPTALHYRMDARGNAAWWRRAPCGTSAPLSASRATESAVSGQLDDRVKSTPTWSFDGSPFEAGREGPCGPMCQRVEQGRGGQAYGRQLERRSMTTTGEEPRRTTDVRTDFNPEQISHELEEFCAKKRDRDVMDPPQWPGCRRAGLCATKGC